MREPAEAKNAAPIADPKKFVAGCILIVAALAAGVVGLIHDHTGTVVGSFAYLVFGVNFVAEARRVKEIPPHHPGLRWYHVALATVLIAAIVFWIYRITVR